MRKYGYRAGISKALNLETMEVKELSHEVIHWSIRIKIQLQRILLLFGTYGFLRLIRKGPKTLLQ